MTNRRAAAEQHRKAEQNRPPMTGSRHYVAGTGAVTTAEREATADGIKAGAKLRLRQRAAEVVEINRALAADGLSTDYAMPETDRETGEPLDARAVLAEAEQRAAGHRKGRWLLADTSRMTSADVAKLADYGRRCARRMTRAAMPEAELDDIAADIALAILERGGTAPAERCRRGYCGARADWRVSVDDGVGAAVTVPLCTAHATTGERRPILHTDATGARWNALSSDRRAACAPAPLEGAPPAGDDRNRWRGFAYLEARRAVGAWRDRTGAETAADWTEPGEDAPTPEQRAAMAAESASAALSDALTTAAPLTHFLAATAPGSGPMKPAETDALAMAVTGLSRADIAKARGVDTEAVKKGAQRGRKHLAARVPDVDTAREWARAAERRMRPALTAPLWAPGTAPILSTAPGTDAERLAAMMVPALPRYRPVRLSWPDRAAEYAESGAMTLPSRDGAGHRANVARPVYGCAERAPTPRATVSGAPTLPYHLAHLRPLARTARAMDAIARDWFTSGYGVRTAAPEHSDAEHYAPIPAPSFQPATVTGRSAESERMRTGARESRQRAARWDAPPQS